ncbi:PepSY-associated TM helix domain-containing protein [Rapidithrix thailandica]|uniref:PepSY-associated TM helix domain-containing protein n=1 Tax=Rapidithrix thailandica TaxID=413964 RepID=A0AAW9SDV7_9BACT
MTFKKLVGKLHLWLGLGSGLVVFIVSITGCIYVFSQEIHQFVDREVLEVPASSSGTRLPASVLWEKAAQALGEDRPIGWASQYRDPKASWSYSTYQPNPEALTYFGALEKYESVYLDPYTGEVLGFIDHKYDFFNIVKFLHWSLLLNTPYGQPIVGWSTFIFVILLISGMILWWPKNKKARKQRFTVKWNARWRRVNYDLHNVLGFYIASMALILAFTGMVWAFTWFKGLVYVAASGTTTPPDMSQAVSTPLTSPVSSNPMDLSMEQVWKIYPEAYCARLYMPADSTGIIMARVQQLPGVYYKSSEMQFDQYSAELLKHRRHEDKNTGEKLITANYDIHVGAILGIPGKILAFFASLICASLPVSGFMIWWGRRKKSKQKSKTPQKKKINPTAQMATTG